MKKITLLLSILSVAILSLSASYAFSDAGPYVGVSYSEIDYKETGVSLDFTTVGGVAGYSFSNSFAIETRYAKGREADHFHGYEVTIDRTFSALGKFSLPNATTIKPYVVAGWTKGTMTVEGYGSDSITSPSWGIGIGLDLASNLSINAELLSAINKDDVQANQFSLIALYKF